MKTYALKIALRGVSPIIWRHLRISGFTSFADLHRILQIVFGGDDDPLHRFPIYGKDYGIAYAGGMSFSDDPDIVYLDDFDVDVRDGLTYEYNLFDHWLHAIRTEAIEAASTSTVHPFCTKGNGMSGATRYDVYDRTMNLFKAIVDWGESTGLGGIRCPIDALDAVRFNREKVNRSVRPVDLKKPKITQNRLADFITEAR